MNTSGPLTRLLQKVAAISIVALCNSSTIAAPGDVVMAHNFGRFVETCSQFDLHIAFARGQIMLQAPRAPGGGHFLRQVRSDGSGAYTVSVGTDDCLLTIRFERSVQ